MAKRVSWSPAYKYFGLSAVEFPTVSWVEEIEDRAFAETRLKEFSAPRQLRTIGAGAFFNCGELARVALNDGLQSVGELCFGGVPAEHVEFPKKCQVGFGNAPSDMKVGTFAIPSGFETIGAGWFAGCGFRKVLVPRTVLEIGENAFRGCPRLKSVEF